MNKIPLMENACKELLSYGVWDGRAKCKYLLKRCLLRRETAKEDLIFWPAGLMAAGLWTCRQELIEDSQGQTETPGEAPESAGTRRLIEMIENALAAYYARWQKKGMPLQVLDDLLSGEVLLHAFSEMEKTRAENMLGLSGEALGGALERLAAYGMRHPTDGAGSFCYRPSHGSNAVFVDGIGLACPFLYQYGEIFGKAEYKELAVRQIVNFLTYGMDGGTGLPYHGYDMTDGCKHGIIGWGRAVGWLLRGMTGCLLPDYGRQRLEAPYRELVKAVLAWQRPDGYFSWQLQALEGPADTSATGMICAAVRQGIEMGILTDPKYGQALRNGKNAVCQSVKDGKVYHCSGECEGFGQYPQRYGAYPWALGTALTLERVNEHE